MTDQTDRLPLRATEIVRVIEPGRVVETTRILEFADQQLPVSPAGRELPRGYDPALDSPMAGSGWQLARAAPVGAPAHPPAPAGPVPWWRWWVR